MNSNINYLKIIYSGFINAKKPKEIHKALYQATINEEIKDFNSLEYAKKLTDRIYKKLPRKDYVLSVAQMKFNDDSIDSLSLATSMLVFSEIEKAKAYENLRKRSNERARDYETEEKEKTIKDTFENNRGRKRVFYLASSHKDCAKDHLDAQGKIYVDENWKSITNNDKRVEKYIKDHNVETIQNIMDKPTWFITRPNCRHYFVAVNTDELISDGINKLKAKYKTETAIGDRQYLQTLKRGKTKTLIAEQRNAELMIEKYEEKLQMLKTLKIEEGNDLIYKAIKKYRMLIAKWKNYLKVLKKRK